MTADSDDSASAAADGTGRSCRLALFGGRGGALVVAGYALAARFADGEAIGLLNDEAAAGERIGGFRVLGGFAAWPTLPPETRFVAPLHKVREMPARARRIRALALPEARWALVIDPRAAVAPDALLGAGSHVGPHAEIQPGVRIGRHVGLRGGARIAHDCMLGDFAFVGVNAVVCGYAQIGEGAHIAPQAAIREGTRVGRYAVVGLGAVVVADVPDFAIVAGNPARRIGTVPDVDPEES